jgi:hypothetical protein
MNRDPYDGRPYYCEMCGLPYEEVMACEEVDCCLETEAAAQSRKLRRRSVTSCAPAEET